jgi:hypothetical protein
MNSEHGDDPKTHTVDHHEMIDAIAAMLRKARELTWDLSFSVSRRELARKIDTQRRCAHDDDQADRIMTGKAKRPSLMPFITARAQVRRFGSAVRALNSYQDSIHVRDRMKPSAKNVRLCGEARDRVDQMRICLALCWSAERRLLKVYGRVESKTPNATGIKRLQRRRGHLVMVLSTHAEAFYYIGQRAIRLPQHDRRISSTRQKETDRSQ